MDENNLSLPSENFLRLLAIEHTSKEQDRDDQKEGWQKFINRVEGESFVITFLVVVAVINHHEACPGC